LHAEQNGNFYSISRDHNQPIDHSHKKLISKTRQGGANKSPQLDKEHTKMIKIAKFGYEML
jgi:hypothetical protein